MTRREIEWLRYSILGVQREGEREWAAMLREFSLTPAQAEVLTVVDAFGPVSVRQIGRLLVCETGNPSRLVKGLVLKGWIERSPDPDDERRVLLRLSPTGQTLVPQIRALEDQWYTTVSNRLRTLVPGSGWDTLAMAWLSHTPSGQALKRRGLWPPSEGSNTHE
ncbi:MAG: MarR family winged helix-turn-helix transcriptional regulator [Firmicutes bacterium]|nr:MarR family winged helix-turn-helix transcriptional regulator [Bacillota bacterium]